ncbi:MAG: ImmA/IrrE family metallo-endopeptidase [Bacteroidales bacterium]|nr:ImmA/IrrE family metallo-endopeptidase [Bacteroidales bacterium]
MKEIFAKRLKSARILSGLSQDELVVRIGNIVSKNAISKYEKGEMMADGKVIISLSKALNVKSDYFFRPFTVEIEKIEFRKKSKLSVKKANAITQKVTDIVERYLEVEQFLSIRSEFSNPIENLEIKTKRDVENAVNQLLKKWKLGYNSLSNVIEVLEEKEIKVIEIEAPDEFVGFSGWADGKPAKRQVRYPVIVINKRYTIERKRLTALHELGHLLLKFNKNISQKDKERMCYQFAGAMLIPEETFRMEFGNNRSHISIPELIAIKENYGISIQAIMQRAKDLEIISDFTYLNFRKWISKNRSEEGLGQYIGKEQTGRLNQLIFRAASEEVISMSKAANLANLKLAAFRKELVAL